MWSRCTKSVSKSENTQNLIKTNIVLQDAVQLYHRTKRPHLQQSWGYSVVHNPRGFSFSRCPDFLTIMGYECIRYNAFGNFYPLLFHYYASNNCLFFFFYVKVTISLCFGLSCINYKDQHYILRAYTVCQHGDLATDWTAKLGFNPNQTHPNLALVLNMLLIQWVPETLSWRGRVAGTLCVTTHLIKHQVH